MLFLCISSISVLNFRAVVKSMRDLKVDGSKYDQLLKYVEFVSLKFLLVLHHINEGFLSLRRHVSEAPWDADSFSEKIKKVRDVFSQLKHVVDSAFLNQSIMLPGVKRCSDYLKTTTKKLSINGSEFFFF